MLKALTLQKKRTALNTKLKQLRAKQKKLRDQETDLEKEIEALEEIPAEIEAQVDELSQQQTQVSDDIAQVLDELETIEAQLDAIEQDGAGDPADDEEEERGRPAPQRRAAAQPVIPESGSFRSRSRCFTSRSQRDAFYALSDVKEFLGRVRSMLGAKPASRRGVTGADLTIPTVVLDLLRDNMNEYSKLITKVRKKSIKGRARQNVLGEVPEGVWTEMPGVLNELTFTLTEVEMDGYKVGGYIPIDNYMLEDSDVNLGEEILYMLGQAIGLALDKAIVYGTGAKMPVGFVTRLAETAEPAYWGDNQGTWTDLHTSNVKKLSLTAKAGTEFFDPLLRALGVAKTNYTDGIRTWVMNETTKTDLLIRSLGVNSAAALVAGMENTMPILGGEIVTEEFMPDNTIAGGALGAYLLSERDGGQFGYSDLPLYIQDKTVFKGTARYDGKPVRGENFVIVNYANVDPATTISFAPDTANTESGGEGGEG